MSSEKEMGSSDHPRWQLLRDVLSFQLKLAIDGLRDVILSPISIGTAIYGTFSDRQNPGKYFYRLLKTGHDSDRWINLFSTYDTDESLPSPDTFVKKAQSIVLNEYERGGVISDLKNHTDSMINKMQKKETDNKD